jgi:hypothetical protein
MEIKPVVMVLADISGYSNFIHFRSTTLLHAEEIITHLLESVLDRAKHPLILNKIEGDALFLYALTNGNDAEVAGDVLQQVQEFFVAFRHEASQTAEEAAHVCPCEACQNAGQLKLKAILHQGEVVFKTIRQFEELAGDNVILLHRLLKNTLPRREYILLTEKFYELSGAPQSGAPQTWIETYPDLGAVPLRVLEAAA